MIRMTHLKLGTLLLAAVFSTSALAQFVWIDEHGVKQFSDTPPPASIPAKNILKQPHRAVAVTSSDAASTPDDAAKPADGAKPGDSKAPKSLADKNADFNKRKADQAAKDKKTAEDTKRKQENEENCKRAKDYLAALKSGARMQTSDQNGERSFLDDDARTKEVDRAQKQVDDCDKAG